MANIAFWQGKCYSPLDFNYIFYLGMNIFRQLTRVFGMAVASISVLAAPAHGQNAETQAPPCGRVEAPGYDHVRNCATPGYETPMTLAEVQAEPDFGRIVVLHFGQGMLDSDLAAHVLTTTRDTPAIAVPGGPDNAVQLVIAGATTERLIFNQQMQDRRVGTLVPPLYQRRIAAMDAAASRTTGAQVVRTAANTGPTGSD